MEIAKSLIETLQIDNIDIPVVKPENLIKIKKLSNRPRDLLDIQTIQENMTET